MSSLDQDPEADAAQRGQVVILPGPREVFVDVDTDEDYAVLQAQIERLRSNGFAIAVTKEHPSASGLPHRHVYLEVNTDLTPLERVALQAALGSDRTRELLSLLRIWLHPHRAPTTFFEDREDLS